MRFGFSGLHAVWSECPKIFLSKFGRMLKQRIQTTVLDNGVTVMTDAMPNAYSVSVGAWIPRGSRHEAPDECGLSHFYEHLVFKGTEHRTALEIASSIEDRGGNLDAYTTRQETGFYAQVSREDVPLALDVIADMMMNPLLNETEMEKERKVIIEEIRSYDDIAEERVGDLFNEIHFKGSGIARPIAGTAKSVRALTRAQMLRYEHQVLHDIPIYVCAAGKVNHEAIVELCVRLFAKKKSGRRFLTDVYRANAKSKTITKRELQQSNLFWGTSFAAEGLPDEFRYAFSVFNVAMGAGMASRLFQKIREERGLAYSVYSSADIYRDCYGWGVSLATDPHKLEIALGLAQEELNKFLADGLAKGELERTQRNIIGGIRICADSSEKRVLRLAEQILHYGKFYPMDETEKGFAKITGAEVLDMMRAAFRDAPFATAVVEPAVTKKD